MNASIPAANAPVSAIISSFSMRSGRAHRHVDQPHAGGERLDLGRDGVSAAREDIDRDAYARQLGGDLAHVDVHPTGLAAAERRERGGVH